jgi:hypothetical protein
MAVNPTEWLSTTLEVCCKKYFGGYLYDACMGRYPPDDDCNVMLFYPDWNGSNEGCIDDGKYAYIARYVEICMQHELTDLSSYSFIYLFCFCIGQEPYYMLSNHDFFLSNTREECCKKFYAWDLYSCTGTAPTLTNGEYYPDWSGGSNTCVKDGEIPDYMLYNNQAWYLSTTLQKCCEKHFYWNINECLGTSPDDSAVGTDKWYVEWDTNTCVQDCVGASPCGGIAETWDQLYSSKEQCCNERLPWISKCRFHLLLAQYKVGSAHTSEDYFSIQTLSLGMADDDDDDKAMQTISFCLQAAL